MAAGNAMERARDEERLLFVVELLISNAPSLVADLNSAKYALLSFTEKSRNEVKQKGSLLRAVETAFRKLVELRDCLYKRQRVLQQLETELVQPSRSVLQPPVVDEVRRSYDNTIVTASIQHQNCNNNEKENNEVLAGEYSEISPPAKGGGRGGVAAATTAASAAASTRKREGMTGSQYDHNGSNIGSAVPVIAALVPADQESVREAESLLEERREELARLAKERNQLERQLEADGARYGEIVKHVQNLRMELERTRVALTAANNEQEWCRVLRSEFDERRRIFNDAECGRREIFSQCRREELTRMRSELDMLQVSIANCQREREKKKQDDEMELAVYQIAYKEQQAAAEEIKDSIAHLNLHQRKLEVLAKQQEVEEAKRNGIRRVMMNTLGMSSGAGNPSLQELSPEHLAEVRNEHRMVSFLATRVGIMEERRRSIMALLLCESPVEDDTVRMKLLLEKVHDMLLEEIIIDEETLQYEGEICSAGV